MNQKKNRGFTLIELLAVIVILAIIALIAVPIIMNIISKSNKSAFKDTAYGIVSAGELYFAERQLEPNGMLEDITIELPDTTNKLGLKGEVPTGSILITTEGKIAIAVYSNRYCVTKGLEDKDVTVTEEYESCELVTPEKTLTDLATTSAEVTSVPACLTDGTECTAGTPVAIKVNSTEVYNFYVISETEDEVLLIMNRNIGNKIAWVSAEDYGCTTNSLCSLNDKGPITALNYLNNQTRDWTNIAAIESYIYNNNLNGTTNTRGYQKFVITEGNGLLISQDGEIETTIEGVCRAVLLTYEEVKRMQQMNLAKTPEYLYGDLLNLSDNLSYWFLTANPNLINEGRSMTDAGDINNSTLVGREERGIRPVITLKK